LQFQQYIEMAELMIRRIKEDLLEEKNLLIELPKITKPLSEVYDVLTG